MPENSNGSMTKDAWLSHLSAVSNEKRDVEEPAVRTCMKLVCCALLAAMPLQPAASWRADGGGQRMQGAASTTRRCLLFT